MVFGNSNGRMKPGIWAAVVVIAVIAGSSSGIASRLTVRWKIGGEAGPTTTPEPSALAVLTATPEPEPRVYPSVAAEMAESQAEASIDTGNEVAGKSQHISTIED